MTETNEQLKAEIDAITTHVSDGDRRIRALETTVKRLASGAEEKEREAAIRQDMVRRADFKAPEDAKAYADSLAVKPDGGYTTPAEADVVIGELRLELDGARKAREAQKRVADSLASRCDEAERKLEKITDAIGEAKTDDKLDSAGAVIHYIETAIDE